MPVSGMIVRTVTPSECPWLPWRLNPGRVVFKYGGCSYGVCSEKGVMVSDKPDETPTYEVPFDSVRWIENV